MYLSYLVIRPLGVSLYFSHTTKDIFGHQPSLLFQHQQQQLVSTSSVFKLNVHWSSATSLQYSTCMLFSVNRHRDRLL